MGFQTTSFNLVSPATPTVSVNASTTERHPNGFLSSNNAANGNTTLATVGAGKKWTIMAIGQTATIVGGAIIAKLLLNGVVVDTVSCSASATSSDSMVSRIFFKYENAPQILATQTIVQNLSTAAQCSYDIWYIEE